MSSLNDIYAQLGYSGYVSRSRGHPIALRGDLQLCFSQNWSCVRDINELADLYLCENGRRMFQPSDNHLSYPRDGEK